MSKVDKALSENIGYIINTSLKTKQKNKKKQCMKKQNKYKTKNKFSLEGV